MSKTWDTTGEQIEMTLEVLTMGVGTPFEITLWIDQIRKVVYAGEMTGGQNSRVRAKTIVSLSKRLKRYTTLK